MSREREMAREALATAERDLRDYPPILLAIPCVDWMWAESAFAITTLSHFLPPGSRVHWKTQLMSTIAYKRNHIAETLIMNPELSAVLMIDSDMTPPGRTALQLLSHDLDIVAALCCARQKPYYLSAVCLNGWPSPEEARRPVPLSASGFGCVLIKRRVFEAVARPWFAFDAKNPGIGEDHHFCHRARAAGFQIHGDFQIEVGHVGTTALTPSFARVWRASSEGLRACDEFTAPDHAEMESERAIALERDLCLARDPATVELSIPLCPPGNAP